MVQIQIRALPGAELPSYATAGSAGADLRAYLPENGSLVLPAGASVMVPTGLHLALPSGYEGQVRPRSGLAAKHGVTVLNAPGTIDSDYRGEVRVILINHGSSDYRLGHGERIAQLVIARVEQCRFTAAEHIDDTDRGAGGFGSTGM